MVQEVTFQRSGNTKNADEGGDADGNDLQRSGINKQHGGIQSENIGNDEGTDSQLGGSQGSFHGIGAGNGSTRLPLGPAILLVLFYSVTC